MGLPRQADGQALTIVALMLMMVLSPAKTLDFETPRRLRRASVPRFVDDAAALIALLRRLSAPELARLMDLSDGLAELNAERCRRWRREHTPQGGARQALLAFAGDVYEGLQASSLSTADWDWAGRHLRVLSGLYGLLAPADLIHPHRLEMGTALPNPAGADLYAFWGARLAAALAEDMDAHGCRVLLNLASQEYFRAVPRSALGRPVVDVVFEERRPDGGYKIISFNAKRARGLLARWVIERRARRVVDLHAFDAEGYRLCTAESDDARLVFRREGPWPLARARRGVDTETATP
jgi:cytoplasmic iron level regulating protein YaaA (DUF328/UPF0246 family)